MSKNIYYERAILAGLILLVLVSIPVMFAILTLYRAALFATIGVALIAFIGAVVVSARARHYFRSVVE
ncbi:MAG: hypothetical protein R3338_13525, partial [Thermoanaerobaculia bacterium]|nr:hypothetical protein [Thermoanaerobaculia bacterium]